MSIFRLSCEQLSAQIPSFCALKKCDWIVETRLRKVEGRDQPRGQSLRPAHGLKKKWFSLVLGSSSARFQNVSISLYFFKLFYLGQHFSIRLKPQPVLVVHMDCCSTQRNEKEDILSMRLELPSSRESNLSKRRNKLTGLEDELTFLSARNNVLKMGS